MHSADFVDIPLLTMAEASRVHAEVHAQRAAWRARDDTRPFYTLGAASYLDAREQSFESYCEQAQRSNVVLRSQFGWVLERLRQTISSRVGSDASYAPLLALPGFHIFLFDPAFRNAGASVHYDLQHELIDWTRLGGTPDVSAQLSMTLAIKLPATGGGLLIWNLDRRQLEQMSPEDRAAHSKANRSAARISYTLGHLTIHSGHQLHQIRSASEPTPGDERITLQAHALPVDGRWIIYW
jgi:hypothetical protein